MSKSKQLEKLVRSVAHQGLQLADFDRLLLSRAILSAADVAKFCAILRQSKVAGYEPITNAADRHGLEQAMATVLLDLVEHAYGSTPPRLFAPGPLQDFYAWHDWSSFMMDLDGWVQEAAGPALSLEFERRASSGRLPEEAKQSLLQLLRIS